MVSRSKKYWQTNLLGSPFPSWQVDPMLGIADPLLDIVHIDQVREAPQVARLQQHQGYRLGLRGTAEAGHPHALGPSVKFSRNLGHRSTLVACQDGAAMFPVYYRHS